MYLNLFYINLTFGLLTSCRSLDDWISTARQEIRKSEVTRVFCFFFLGLPLLPFNILGCWEAPCIRVSVNISIQVAIVPLLEPPQCHSYYHCRKQGLCVAEHSHDHPDRSRHLLIMSVTYMSIYRMFTFSQCSFDAEDNWAVTGSLFRRTRRSTDIVTLSSIALHNTEHMGNDIHIMKQFDKCFDALVHQVESTVLLNVW